MEFVKRNPKIFILSGKAQSGKDTVSKIIENYYNNKKCIQIAFAYYIKDYVKRISDWDGSEDTKPRELLQQFGIELVKNKIDNKLFINRVIEDIEVFSYFYDIIIVDDARLPDEVDILKKKYPNSVSIRIIRNNYDNGLTQIQKNHITETGLDNYNDFDYIVNNDENINQTIEEILKEVKI